MNEQKCAKKSILTINLEGMCDFATTCVAISQLFFHHSKIKCGFFRKKISPSQDPSYLTSSQVTINLCVLKNRLKFSLNITNSFFTTSLLFKNSQLPHDELLLTSHSLTFFLFEQLLPPPPSLCCCFFTHSLSFLCPSLYLRLDCLPADLRPTDQPPQPAHTKKD